MKRKLFFNNAEGQVLKSFFSYFRGNVLVITVTRMILFSTSQLFDTYFSLYVLALGGSKAQIGLVQSFASLATVLIFPIAGYLADSVGRVKVICAAFYGRSLPYLLFSVAQDWPMLAVGKFGRGLTACQAPAMGAIMADSVPPSRRGVGFASMNAIPLAISLIAPYLGGYVITVYGIEQGMRYLAVWAAIGCISVATIRIKFLKETLREVKEVPLRNIPSLLRTSYQNTWRTLKETPQSLRPLIFIMVLGVFVASMAGPFWVVYAIEEVRLNELDWGVILLLIGILRLTLALPAGAIVDKFGKKKVFTVALALSIPTVFLFTYCTTFIQVLVVLLALNSVSTFMGPACQTLVADTVPREMRGRYSAAFGRGAFAIRANVETGEGFTLALASMVGLFAGGFIYSFNYTYPWLLLSAALCLSLIVAIVFVKEPIKTEF